MVVPLSDWFWCGQPLLRPVRSLQRLKCTPALSQHPYFIPLLPSFGLPCSGATIRVLSFVATPLVCTCLWAGHRFFARTLTAASRLHAWPRLTVALLRPGSSYAPVPCLRFCRGNGDLFQSRESTFAGLIFLCRGDEWVHLTDTPPNSLGPSAGKSGGFKLSWGGHFIPKTFIGQFI